MFMETISLNAVLNHPAVWRGGDQARVVVPSVPTGFAELDALLPGGGWPSGALTEIYPECPGLGEMQLIMPAAARLTRAGRWLALIAPPYIPYAPALTGHNVKLSRLMLIRPESSDEILWACEQVLRTDGCGAVLAWLDHVPERTLRRLQLAAENGNALAILFHSDRIIPASPVALKLHISKSDGKTMIRILKRRGGGVSAPIALSLHGASSKPSQARPVAFGQARALETPC